MDIVIDGWTTATESPVDILEKWFQQRATKAKSANGEKGRRDSFVTKEVELRNRQAAHCHFSFVPFPFRVYLWCTELIHTWQAAMAADRRGALPCEEFGFTTAAGMQPDGKIYKEDVRTGPARRASLAGAASSLFRRISLPTTGHDVPLFRRMSLPTTGHDNPNYRW